MDRRWGVLYLNILQDAGRWRLHQQAEAREQSKSLNDGLFPTLTTKVRPQVENDRTKLGFKLTEARAACKGAADAAEAVAAGEAATAAAEEDDWRVEPALSIDFPGLDIAPCTSPLPTQVAHPTHGRAMQAHAAIYFSKTWRVVRHSSELGLLLTR